MITFGMLYLGGDPVDRLAGETASAAERARLREQLGFDQPVLLQYTSYAGRLLNGDLGQSVSMARGQPVINLLSRALPVTLTIGLGGLFVALLIGIPAGVISARFRDTVWDYSVMLLALMGICMPVFWRALLLILLFAVQLRWLPASGIPASDADLLDQLSHYMLPWLAVGAFSAGIFARMTRSGLLDVLNEDFVRTARAKGLSERSVVYGHALRAGMLPLVTVVGIQLSTVLGGTVLTEFVFGMPGLGHLMLRAVVHQDFPVVMGAMLTVALTVVVANFIVDLLYLVADPRVRYE